jgi:hypothetical protein
VSPLEEMIVVVLALGWGMPVGAQENQEPASPPTSSASQPAAPPGDVTTKPAPAEPPPRRDVPNYRQLDPEPTTAGDLLIWVPRVVLRFALGVTYGI